MSIAIIVDDSRSTAHNPITGQLDGYTLRAEIAIAEAYLRKHPDADIFGLCAGKVDDLDDLFPDAGTPWGVIGDVLPDYDQVVIIMDSFGFNGPEPTPKQLGDVTKALVDTDLHVVLVMGPEFAASRLASFLRDPAPVSFLTHGGEGVWGLSKILIPHITMIVDPRAILDFGF